MRIYEESREGSPRHYPADQTKLCCARIRAQVPQRNERANSEEKSGVLEDVLNLASLVQKV